MKFTSNRDGRRAHGRAWVGCGMSSLCVVWSQIEPFENHRISLRMGSLRVCSDAVIAESEKLVLSLTPATRAVTTHRKDWKERLVDSQPWKTKSFIDPAVTEKPQGILQERRASLNTVGKHGPSGFHFSLIMML